MASEPNKVMKQLAALRRRMPRGQATVEYTWVAHATLIMGTLGVLPVITHLFNQITLFYTSVYTVIQTAAI